MSPNRTFVRELTKILDKMDKKRSKYDSALKFFHETPIEHLKMEPQEDSIVMEGAKDHGKQTI